MVAFWNSFKKSLSHLIFPEHCLHCRDLLPSSTLYCESCLTLLELIDPKERCPTCFGLHNLLVFQRCVHCQRSPQPFVRVGAAFDYLGPAATLIKKLKYGNQPHLAAGAAAFLVAQLDRLEWPLPHAIVPVPLSLTHWIDRGYNQSQLIAEKMSEFLNVPVLNVLKRYSGDYSQAGLSLSQRRELEGKSFKLKNSFPIRDKTLLVIDDVMTSGSTLRKCGEALLEGYPGDLYGLAFCRAVK